MKILFSVMLALFIQPAFSQQLSGKDIIGKKLDYRFTGGTISMVIHSDSTLYWRDDSKPREANEKTKTIHINEHTIMTAWYESDKTFVTLLSDFARMKVSGMVCRADGKFYAIEGVIQVKE